MGVGETGGGEQGITPTNYYSHSHHPQSIMFYSSIQQPLILCSVCVQYSIVHHLPRALNSLFPLLAVSNTHFTLTCSRALNSLFSAYTVLYLIMQILTRSRALNSSFSSCTVYHLSGALNSLFPLLTVSLIHISHLPVQESSIAHSPQVQCVIFIH